MIDLHIINSYRKQNQNSLTEEDDIPKDDNMHISSRQWKEETASGFANIWDRTLAPNILTDRAGLEPTGYDDGKDDPPGQGGGLLRTQPKHSLGESNFSSPFIHFPWNDAPLMSTGEYMLVPGTEPGRLGVEFHDNGKGSFFGAFLQRRPRFSYEYRNGPQWHVASPYYDWGDSTHPAFTDSLRFFEYVHVPSHFAGARTSAGSVYRQPGKINIHTLSEEGWEALRNGRDIFPSYEEFCDYRRSRLGESRLMLLLLGLDAETGKLIDVNADNPYMALENLMRLSDVTTTQSNVFAAWITMGYFNVDETGKLGAERGLDDGTVRRHRSFYLIDRSTPVGFRLG
jgi:hypothetical protein